MTRLAVLGHPIAHSRSPQLHAAAYRVLGLDWRYESVDVDSAGLPQFVAGLDSRWRGLSLTMPLKRTVLPLLASCDDLVALIGVANTVLFERDSTAVRLHGFNTDVDGVVETLRDAHVDVSSALVLGAGATAASVLVALRRLGADSATVAARSPEKATALRLLAERIGLDLRVDRLTGPGDHHVPPLIVSTLPGSAEITFPVRRPVSPDAVLFDVAYDPAPTPLTSVWLAAGGRSVSGLHLLVHQALRQVRIFVSGDPERALDREPLVLAAMRDSVGLGTLGAAQP